MTPSIDLELKGGRLASEERVVIGIAGGTIIYVEKHSRPGARQYIDVAGFYVLPGVINLHVHDRTPGDPAVENWNQLAPAAIRGGMIHLCKMPNTTNPAITTLEALEQSCVLIGKQPIGYSVWFGATPDNIVEIEQAARDPRVCGIKLYMGSTTGNLLVIDPQAQRRIFEVCARLGKPVACHMEDEEMLRLNRRLLGRQPLLPDHCIIRNTEVAKSAARQAVQHARDTRCKLHMCHVSTPEEVEIAQDAKQAGLEVTLEVAPHHLLFDRSKMYGQRAGYYKMNPPLRTHKQVRELSRYVCRRGFVDAIADDHAPQRLVDKCLKRYDDVPSGMPGVQTTLPLMLGFVQKGKMSLEHLVQLMATNPARIAGLPHKGTIAVGYDADLICVKPQEAWSIRREDIIYACGWTPYAGMIGYGVPKLVMSNGNVVLNLLGKDST